MWEAGRSMIDEMMGRLGETAGLLAGDQTRGRVISSGPKGVNPGILLVVADPWPEGDRGVDNESRSPNVIGVSD
jgi:hypothetical protein